jgi:hypothetical protein
MQYPPEIGQGSAPPSILYDQELNTVEFYSSRETLSEDSLNSSDG